MDIFPRKVRKAVFPVAGLGTRFLPATKSIPKEMLPIVDKPLIQYAVEEALEAGVDTLIFITSRKKHAITDPFDSDFDDLGQLKSVLFMFPRNPNRYRDRHRNRKTIPIPISIP